tara:strand:+ start:50 stop:607 length:558 start_codon:yes stop_codon:yes gene_type:complete
MLLRYKASSIFLLYMNDLEDFLLNQVGEWNLVQHIMTMSAPQLNEGIQRDISSFAFTWKVLTEVHVPVAIEEMTLYHEDTLWMVYHDILKVINDLIMEYGIDRDPIGRLYGTRLEMTTRRNDMDFRVYWQNFIISSWSQHESFMMLIGCLTVMELWDLIKKFVLRLTPFARFLLLTKVGVVMETG